MSHMYLVEVVYHEEERIIKRRIADDISAIYDFVETNAKYWAAERGHHEELVAEDYFDYIDVVSVKTGETLFTVNFKNIKKI